MELLARVRRRCRSLRWLQLVLFIAAPVASAGQFDEYDVKAAFLLNFTKFVEWPAGVDDGKLVICIIGDDPFGPTLDRLVKGAKTTSHAIELRRIGNPAEATGCHVAFVRSVEREKATKLLNSVGTAPVLTVGEEYEFAEEGGVVCLWVENGRVKVMINTGAADRAQLKISAKLLSLAQLLPGGHGRD
jgi:hypothetical protein